MSNRAVLSSAFLLFVAGLWACWCDVALLWDGAYQFCSSINSGHAFLYLSRFHSWVVWQPFIWLSHLTGNVRLLKMVYGAPFCFAPLAGVLLSWWIVRRRAPQLMIWPLLGSAIGALPGQVFMINDSIFQIHLFWPVFLAIFLPLTRPQFAAMLVLSLFQLSHPIGIGLCLACCLSAAVFRRWRKPEPGGALGFWALWYTALTAAGVLKLVLWPDSYAAQEATFDRAWMAFRWGVLWWPFIALLATWLLSAYFVWRRLRPASPLVQRLAWLPLALVALAGACLIYWAMQPLLWQTALNYRRWLVPMCGPFMLAAWWELWHRDSVPAPAAERGRDSAGVAVALVFLLTLGIQSATWSRLFARLSAQVASCPGLWIKPAELAWIHETPMEAWGLASQVILSQGRTPRVLLWSEEDELAARENPPRFALSPFNHFTPATQPPSWFDWSLVERAARAGPAPGTPATGQNPLSPLSSPFETGKYPMGNHLDLGRAASKIPRLNPPDST